MFTIGGTTVLLEGHYWLKGERNWDLRRWCGKRLWCWRHVAVFHQGKLAVRRYERQSSIALPALESTRTEVECFLVNKEVLLPHTRME